MSKSFDEIMLEQNVIVPDEESIKLKFS